MAEDMRNHIITSDEHRLQLVWVFQGDAVPTRNSNHPSAVFASLKAASRWVSAHRLSGLITGYTLDVPAFEYSLRVGGVPDHRRDGTQRQVWGGGELHYHVKDGVVLEAPTPRRKRVAQLVAVPSKAHQFSHERSTLANDLSHTQSFLEHIGFDIINVLHDPTTAETATAWEATVSGLNVGDLALFAFFGHGRAHKNDYQLLTKDTPLDAVPTQHDVLRLHDLRRISDACGAERVFLLNTRRGDQPVRSQEHDQPSPPAADSHHESELIRMISGEPGTNTAALLPAHATRPGPVTTLLGHSLGEGSSHIPALNQGLFSTALLTVAQRRMNGRFAIQIDDDFMNECRGVLRGLVAEHELKSTPTLIRHSSEDHRPILVEGRTSIAPASVPQRTNTTSSERSPQLINATKARTQPVFTNSLSMKLARIPAGTFMMGSPATEAGPKEDETPHEVTLTKAFFLGVTQVTQEQWQELMGTNPSFFRGVKHLPVENVSWDDAVEFCSRLSQKEGRRYRLPTEAEWEYACRAGTTTPFNTGTMITPTQANFAVADFDGEPLPPHLSHTTPVGSYAANAFGLYDMHGNVYEWCSDWFGDYPTEAVTDPKGPESSDWRVVRGGCCRSPITALRSANRYFREQGDRHRLTGFRIATDAE